MARTDKGQFAKGVSGNPTTQFQPGHQTSVGLGRPPTRKFQAMVLRKLDQPAVLRDGKGNETALGKTWGEFLLERWLILASRGNATALRELLDRVDGKVPQVIGLEGTQDGPPISVQDARNELAAALAALAPERPERTRKTKAARKAKS